MCKLDVSLVAITAYVARPCVVEGPLPLLLIYHGTSHLPGNHFLTHFRLYCNSVSAFIQTRAPVQCLLLFVCFRDSIMSSCPYHGTCR